MLCWKQAGCVISRARKRIRNAMKPRFRRAETRLKKRVAYGEAILRGEVIVLLEDECLLLGGDGCGRVWGKRKARIEVSMTNERERPTYYGAVNLLTHAFQLKACSAGKGECTVADLRCLRQGYPGQPISLLWDGATDHRAVQVRTLLAEVNDRLDEKDWQLICLPFAPNAPHQNPVADIWLQGKNYLPKHCAQNKTFAAVK